MRVKLTDICDIQYGYAFDSSMFSETEGTPLVRIRDVVRGFTETRTTESFPLEYAVHDGDILIGMDGEFNISRWHGGTAALNQRVCRLIPKDVDADYIFHFMPSALKAIEAKTPFVTVKHLSAKELNKITVPVPTPEEQIRIGTILNRILSIIDSRRRELANLDDLIKARFVEMFGTGDYHSVALKDITEVITKGTTPTTAGFDFVDNGVNFFKIESIMEDHTINLNKVAHVTEECNRAFKRSQLRAGDILFSIAGAIGRTAIITERDLPGNTNQALAIIRLLSDAGLSRRFLISSFESPLVTEQFNRKKRGIAQINLSLQDIGNLIIPVPNKNAQDEFERFGNQVDKSKFVVQQALDKAQLLFDSLMQQYFG